VIPGQCCATYSSRQERVQASVQSLKTGPTRLGEHTPTKKHVSQRHRGGSPTTDLPRSGFVTLSRKSLTTGKPTESELDGSGQIYEETDRWILRPEQANIGLHPLQLYDDDDDNDDDSQSQSHITTDGQSVCLSWCRAPSGAHDQIFVHCLTVTVLSMGGRPP
jgi:hypothetical protein